MAFLKLSISSYQADCAKFAELKDAAELYLSGPMSDEDVGLVCKEVLLQLAPLTTITLDLRECTDNGCNHIAHLIEKNSNIQNLSLVLNNVGEKGAETLAQGLLKSKLTSFSMYAAQLDLHDRCIGDSGTKFIAEAINNHQTLKSLCLAQNRLSNVGLSYIINCLPSSNVHELDVRSNNIDSEGAKLIGSYLAETRTLKKLVLNENRGIQSEGVKEIALSLTRNSSLEQLYLRSCGIGKQGAERFATCLAQNTTLQTLDLCGNIEVGDDAVELISRGLKGNKALLELNLSCCGLGDEGCAHLAEALLVNGTLQQLWLQKNEIGDGGILSLSETLCQNKSLCLLSVSENRFSHKGSTALAQSLRQNDTLTTLDIDGSSNADSIKSMVDILLDKNKQLSRYKNWTKELLQINKELVKQRDSLKKHAQKRQT